MKRTLFWIGAVALAFMLAAAVLYSQEAKYKFIVIYTTPVRDYNRSYAMVCDTPGCNDVYNQEERHRYFQTTKEALDWMNAYVKVDGFPVSGVLYGSEEKVSSIIGLYEIRQLPATLQKVGTQRVYVSKTVEEERPKLEWRLPSP